MLTNNLVQTNLRFVWRRAFRFREGSLGLLGRHERLFHRRRRFEQRMVRRETEQSTAEASISGVGLGRHLDTKNEGKTFLRILVANTLTFTS